MSNSTKIKNLRELMGQYELDGWLVPRADEHQGEYVAPYAERLYWSSGFDGSAGMAIILADKAAVFVDGRYTLQARNQVDASLFEIVHTADVSAGEWLAKNAVGKVIGFDPWLHTENEIKRYQQACAGAGTEFVALEGNLIDDVWLDQPGMPVDAAFAYGPRFAGLSSSEKREKLGQGMSSQGVDAAVLSNLDSIAWLLNIRGTDIPCTPVVLAFAVLHSDGAVDLFIDSAKVDDKLQEYLGADVHLHPYDGFEEYAPALKDKRVAYDPKTGPIQIRQTLEEVMAEVVPSDDVCLLPKACKNEVELNGMRVAHKRDGAALVEFLVWLYDRVQNHKVSELEASQQLYASREAKEHFRGVSFETISGAGPNGAIVHYRVTPESDRGIDPHEVYLLDSGGQYLDGTTDVTRTMVFNKPTAEQKDRFTRVLKGHIAIATAIFPKGTTGAALDVLARKSLWDAELDYQHGTGHGVGCYLCVHEGPQRIAKGMSLDVPLRPGMVISNEPGYYKEGEYGIRIESLVIVREHSPGFMCFETITCAPICRDLVDVSLLNDVEKTWFNEYHQWVAKTLPSYMQPELKRQVKDWLDKQTAAL